MATRRTKKRKPVTAEEIETFLDFLAGVMQKAGRDAELYLPIWRALERELAARQEADSILAAARARYERSAQHSAA